MRKMSLKSFGASPIGIFIISLIGFVLVAFVNYTTRWQVIGHNHIKDFKGQSLQPITLVWHEQLIAFPSLLGLSVPLSALCSPHSDGRFIGYVIKWFGFDVIWGSTNRQPAAALRTMAKQVKAGRLVAIAPDGPRGPAKVLALGPISLAHLTGAPIIPIAWRSSREWRAKGWDRMRFMKPLGRGFIMYGAPIYLEKSTDRDQLEAQRRFVEAQLNDLDQQVEKVMRARIGA